MGIITFQNTYLSYYRISEVTASFSKYIHTAYFKLFLKKKLLEGTTKITFRYCLTLLIAFIFPRLNLENLFYAAITQTSNILINIRDQKLCYFSFPINRKKLLSPIRISYFM